MRGPAQGTQSLSTTVRLCSLAEIPDPGAIELEWGEGDWPASFFVVRRGGDVRAYLNRCPHAGHELNLRGNEFLTSDGDLILCRSHGARFRIDDGLCVFGPCPGAFLRAVGVGIDEGAVTADRDELDRLAARLGP